MFKPEPFGNESLQLTRENCMQQEVRVQLNRCDPAGTFTGQIFKKGEKQDLALTMLEQGLCYCDQWCSYQPYFTAESKAKGEK